MKNSPHQVNQEQAIEFLNEMTFGFLSTLTEQAEPNLKPVNYIFDQGNLYFHGSYGGEKGREIRRGSPAVFAVAKEYSYLPSYTKGADTACPATVFFKSVLLRGKLNILKDEFRKAEVLTTLMQKFQPEGQYLTIHPEDPKYTKVLKATAVIELRVESISGKFKFGQNQDEGDWNQIHSFLNEKGEPLDQETAKNMESTCPFH